MGCQGEGPLVNQTRPRGKKKLCPTPMLLPPPPLPLRLPHLPPHLPPSLPLSLPGPRLPNSFLGTWAQGARPAYRSPLWFRGRNGGKARFPFTPPPHAGNPSRAQLPISHLLACYPQCIMGTSARGRRRHGGPGPGALPGGIGARMVVWHDARTVQNGLAAAALALPPVHVCTRVPVHTGTAGCRGPGESGGPQNRGLGVRARGGVVSAEITTAAWFKSTAAGPGKYNFWTGVLQRPPARRQVLWHRCRVSRVVWVSVVVCHGPRVLC